LLKIIKANITSGFKNKHNRYLCKVKFKYCSRFCSYQTFIFSAYNYSNLNKSKSRCQKTVYQKLLLYLCSYCMKMSYFNLSNFAAQTLIPLLPKTNICHLFCVVRCFQVFSQINISMQIAANTWSLFIIHQSAKRFNQATSI
jgi:hypothetical protein